MKYDNLAELEHLSQVGGCPVRETREEVKFELQPCAHAILHSPLPDEPHQTYRGIDYCCI